jgi:Protein of unknown function TPD sequence-motif
VVNFHPLPKKMTSCNKLVYSPQEIRPLIQLLRRDVDSFEPLTVEKIEAIKRRTPEGKWSNDQIISLWHHLSTQNIFYASRNINKIPPNEIKQINSLNLLDYSREYYVPPLNLIRAILASRGYPKRAISDMIKHPNKITSQDLRQMILLGWQTDSENPGKWVEMIKSSRLFEIEVARLLDGLGVQYQTQEFLAKQQSDVCGRATNTPDFLLLTPIVIRDQVIYWIDAKNFIMAGVNFFNRKAREQAGRYLAEFGPGAFLFHYGYVRGAEIDGVAFLTPHDFEISDSAEEKNNNKTLTSPPPGFGGCADFTNSTDFTHLPEQRQAA